jgi:hypothetical protein
MITDDNINKTTLNLKTYPTKTQKEDVKMGTEEVVGDQEHHKCVINALSDAINENLKVRIQPN